MIRPRDLRSLRISFATATAIVCACATGLAQRQSATSPARPESDSAAVVRIAEAMSSADSAAKLALRGSVNANGDWDLTTAPESTPACWIDRRSDVVCSHAPEPANSARARFTALIHTIEAALPSRGWRLDDEHDGRGFVISRRYLHSTTGARLTVRISAGDDGHRLWLFGSPPGAAATTAP